MVAASVTLANGTAERGAAEAMIGDLPAGGRVTLGAACACLSFQPRLWNFILFRRVGCRKTGMI